MSRARSYQQVIVATSVFIAVSLAFSFQHGQLNAQEPVLTFDLEVTADEVDRVNEIVKAEIAIDGLPAGTYVLTEEKSGTEIIGQYDVRELIGASHLVDLVTRCQSSQPCGSREHQASTSTTWMAPSDHT